MKINKTPHFCNLHSICNLLHVWFKLNSTGASCSEPIRFVKLPILLFSASVAITNTDPSESTEQEAEREKTYHVYARQLYYPGSDVKRFPVPLEKVPWEVPEHKFSYTRTSLSIFDSFYLIILFTCAYICARVCTWSNLRNCSVIGRLLYLWSCNLQSREHASVSPYGTSSMFKLERNCHSCIVLHISSWQTFSISYILYLYLVSLNSSDILSLDTYR